MLVEMWQMPSRIAPNLVANLFQSEGKLLYT